MDVLDLVNDTNQVGPGHDFMVRPFVCKFENCDRAFARKSDLARHFRIHTNERPFVCLYHNCGKAFIQRSALTVHTRVHTGERPHHCETCNKAFADSSSLARHRRIHTGKRPYGCKVQGCGRQFARRNTYLKHFKRQHPELPPPTSSSVRALHIPTMTGRSFLGHGVPTSGSDSPEFDHTPTPTNGPPHGYAASRPPEGAAYPYNGGYVNGMLHSSQLAHSQQGAGGFHAYFHPTHAEAQEHGGLGHPGGGVEHGQQSGQTTPGERAGDVQYPQPGAQLGFNGAPIQQNGSAGGGEGGEQSIFAYQDNSLSRVPTSGGGPMNNPSFHNSVQQAHWGGPVGGFATSQLSLPSPGPGMHPSYQQQQAHLQQQQQAYQHQTPPVDSVKAEPQSGNSPISERGNSPDLVDVNTLPVPAIKYQQPVGSFPPMAQFTGLTHNHLPNSMIPGVGGQPVLYAVPPQMQRFHSAPVIPTMNNNPWNNLEQFKATTPGAPGAPGFDGRMPVRRVLTGGEAWQQIPPPPPPAVEEGSHHDASDVESIKSGKPPSLPQGAQNWNPSPTFPTVRGAQFRYASAGSMGSPGSSALHASHTARQLPPMNMFSNGQQPTGYFTPHAPQAWAVQHRDQLAVNHNMVGRHNFAPPQMVQQDSQDSQLSMSSDKLPMGRDRLASGVSSVGFGLANVTFDDGEESGKEENDNDKPWTPSAVGSPEEGEEELDSDDDDDAGDHDSDDDFVLGSKPKRKTSGGGAKRGRGRAMPRPTSHQQQQRRVLA